MQASSTIHRVTYHISVQSEHHPFGPPLFRGTLETVAGQEFEFGTLAELNHLLCEVGGWIDAPPLVISQARLTSRSSLTHSSVSEEEK